MVSGRGRIWTQATCSRIQGLNHDEPQFSHMQDSIGKKKKKKIALALLLTNNVIMSVRLRCLDITISNMEVIVSCYNPSAGSQILEY